MPLTIICDEETFALLQQIAQERHVTPEVVAQQAVTQFAKQHAAQPGEYSFIGIGHSGRRDLVRQVDAQLAEGADNRAGWSLG